jgi:hypothetical protein
VNADSCWTTEKRAWEISFPGFFYTFACFLSENASDVHIQTSMKNIGVMMRRIPDRLKCDQFHIGEIPGISRISEGNSRGNRGNSGRE